MSYSPVRPYIYSAHCPQTLLAEHKPAIKNLVFSSRPGFKSFIKWKDLSKSVNGVGILIMSTNKGIITNEEAFYRKVGGQCLFKIY